MTTDFQIEGFNLLRLLSDRERSRVFMARSDSGDLCAIKLQQPKESRSVPAILERYKRLQPLTTQPGLLPILAYGATQNGWVWESLPLGDNLPGLTPLTDDVGLQQYTPLTLRAWITERGPTPAKCVAEWGQRLAEGLGVLHQAGFIHRDVKPTNIVFIHGIPHLGDYGLLGEPGSSADFSGTEGFQPVEGTNDFAADLFGLGKTLYETWTACDRLEFPSVPKAVLDAPDWNPSGHILNEFLLRACHGQPQRRFLSAKQFSEALSHVISGRRPINRRRWLVTAACTAAVVTGALVILRQLRAPAIATWRRVPDKLLSREAFLGSARTVDWKRRRIYSLRPYKGKCLFQAFELDSFELADEVEIQGGPKEDNNSTILNPATGELWVIEGGHGEVFALDPETKQLKSLGGGPNDERHYGARTYWNPVTRRVGVFGGYGQSAVRNDRSEFDSIEGKWVEIETNRPNMDPWPREMFSLIPHSSETRLYLVGGQGSPSGVQREHFRALNGLRGSGDHFYLLEDIWELNLDERPNAWRKLLPLGYLDPRRLRAAVYYPRINGLVIFLGGLLGDRKPESSVWLFRPAKDRRPVKLKVKGEPPPLNGQPGQGHIAVVDPQSSEILFLEEEIFRVSIDEN